MIGVMKNRRSDKEPAFFREKDGENGWLTSDLRVVRFSTG